MKFLIATLAGIALVSSLSVSGPQDIISTRTLEGTWRITSLNGRQVPDVGPQTTLSIIGERYQQALDGKVSERGTLKLDASKRPVTIDLVITEGDDSGKTQLGIVEVVDGLLRMCLDTPDAGQRPSEFAVKSGALLIEARKNQP